MFINTAMRTSYLTLTLKDVSWRDGQDGHYVTCYNIYSFHLSLISTTLGIYLRSIMIVSLMMAF
jgi:hypothetical protein